LKQQIRKLLITPGMKLPVDEPPLRVAGETQRSEYDDALLDIIMLAPLLAVASPILSLGATWRIFVQHGLYAWLVSATLCFVVASVIGPLSLRTLLKGRKDVRAHFLGWQAEVVVGMRLGDARDKGYKIFNDVPETAKDGKLFNLDHVAIGPGGIYVIETKGRSKSEDGGSVDDLKSASSIHPAVPS